MVIEDGAGLEDLQGLATGVGDGSLDAGVADELDGEVEGRVALGQVDRGRADQGGEEGGTDEELHCDGSRPREQQDKLDEDELLKGRAVA